MIIKTFKCLVCFQYYSGLNNEPCPAGCTGRISTVYEQNLDTRPNKHCFFYGGCGCNNIHLGKDHIEQSKFTM